MKKIIIFLVLVILNQSCSHNKLPELFNIQITTLKDNTLDKISSALGRNYIQSYDIILNTSNSHYCNYIAVVEENLETNKLELLHYKLFNEEAIENRNSKIQTTNHLNKKISYDLLFDQQMSKYLGNNKVYFSMHGDDVNEIGLSGGMASYYTLKQGVINHSDQYPIRLFSGHFINSDNNMGKEHNNNIKFQIGFISYDKKQNIDFEGYFNSLAVKRFIRDSYHNILENDNTYKSPDLKIENYRKNI